MLNIFLLGNGFDLHYCLPTGYADFLNTIDYLCKHKGDPIYTVGDVFRELAKDENNKIIRKSYDKYWSCYDFVELPNNELTKLVFTAEENKWFRYFIERKIKGNGWIDFEKEIKRVLSLIDETINEYACSQARSEERRHSSHIPTQSQSDIRIILVAFELGKFGKIEPEGDGRGGYKEYFVSENSEEVENYDSRDLKEFYHLNFDSGRFYFRPDLNCIVSETPRLLSLNKEAIVDELLSSLRECSFLLTTYLKLFVENPLKNILKEGVVDLDEAFESDAIVVSLNYTRTYELLYRYPNHDYDALDSYYEDIIQYGVSLPRVCHIHGITSSQIVLGADSDSKDELNELDTMFIGFKKYYQRVIYKTDRNYLRLLQKIQDQQNIRFQLFVFGHSLDETDRDIIIELFDLADSITIFYLKQSDLEQYVRRLVSIYGKKEFDHFRVSKDLTFFHTDELNQNWRILSSAKESSLI